MVTPILPHSPVPIPPHHHPVLSPHTPPSAAATGNTACSICPVNTYAPSSGSGNTAGTTNGPCTACYPRSSTNGQTGRYGRGSNNPCTACASGFSSYSGQSCFECPVGTQSTPATYNGTSYATCAPCDKFTYTNT